MSTLQKYSLEEIGQRLNDRCFPFSGITELGSCEFHFLKPSFYAGVVMHTGSRIRPELLDAILVNEEDRFREEDPYADAFIRDMPIRIIARDSRFEYDLNREKESCIYPYGTLKYGMEIWKRPLTSEEEEPGHKKHQEFHDLMDLLIEFILKENRYALVFDMHTYCYQREEKIPWYDDPNPEINLGTKAVNRELFGDAIESFMGGFSGQSIDTDQSIVTDQSIDTGHGIDKHPLRIAENKIFNGGYLSRRLSKKWHDQVLTLAIEYKKIFMDEWSGEIYPDILKELVGGFNQACENLFRSSLI